MKRAHRVVLLVAVAAAIAACGGPSSSAGSSPVDGPVLRHPDTAAADGSDAEVRGRLELEGDCLYAALDDVGERYPMVWPAGTAWDAEEQDVIGPSNERMPIGREVDGGGGYHSLDDVERLLGEEAAALAGRCVDNEYGEIAIVNNHDGAIRLVQ